MSEQDYMMGRRAAWHAILQTCLRELGVDDADAGQARWVSEREETIAMLRQVCDSHGDNDWDESLHLADVVDKHLMKHLEANVKLTRLAEGESELSGKLCDESYER